MNAHPPGLLATSVFIAPELERTLGQIPPQVTVSVVTIGELELGVLSAKDGADRVRRGDTLSLARTIDPVPVTESIMSEWARLVVACRHAGITRTVRLTDAFIAATAIDLGLPVVTQDDDFDRIALAHPMLEVLKV